MDKKWGLVVAMLLCLSLSAQIKRVEPPNWWVGMNNPKLQLLVYGDSISQFAPSIINIQGGPFLEGFHKGESPNYLFLDVVVPKECIIGEFPIRFTDPSTKESFIYHYDLKPRVKKAEDYHGFDASDVIYLITPDRFANADPQNDRVDGLLEQTLDRSHDYKRHGGDLQGIVDRVPYLDDMGFTALWPSPVLENNMPAQSYHGYAITDFYKVDPRFGSLGDYRMLSQKLADRGMKLVMDQVANHCGSEHWWMKDLPFEDWINYQVAFSQGDAITTTNHRRTANQDPYASQKDRALMEEGWFVPAMPDLNQRNPFMAQYLIQNSIWWIETLQLGGIRQDTYPYPNKDFMADWAGAIMAEYPNFNIVGEEWSYNPLLVGYWQQGAKNKDGYRSNLRSTMDFPLQQALVEALTEPESWDKGWVKLYEGLANDFHYPDPSSILLFPDNHDMDRIFTQLNEDVALTKMALAFVLTAPRIPQLYYGTEILMQNTAKPGDHGLIRTDFPGGWEGDTVNAFSGMGLTETQANMRQFLKKLLHFRKNSKAIHQGKTTHFAPDEGIYVLFRYVADEMVIICLNKNEQTTVLELSRFEEMGIEGQTFINIVNDSELTLKGQLTIGPKQALILSRKKG